jgi:hypothetical protein
MENGMRTNQAKGRTRNFKRFALLLSIVPALTMVSLSPAEKGDQPIALDIYLAEQARKPEVRRQVEERFQRPFHQITAEQYATYMEGLNLDRDEDLFEWSHVTGIPIVALRKTSFFFRMNLHLMEDMDAAEQLRPQIAYKYKTFYDEITGQIYLRDDSGATPMLRILPDDLLTQTDRIGRYWHYRNFMDSEIDYEVIGPYLIRLGDVPYRDALGEWIREMPLSIIKTYRGKAIYVTNVPGRSFSTTMPVSNTVYKLHIGLKTGIWIETRSDGIKGTRINFNHELGHVFDYVVLQGGYGGFRDSHQFPEFRGLLTEKENIFGAKDELVPNTPFGYISNYAKMNAQESYAAHFGAYIDDKEHFRAMAETEAAQGHPELMRKYQFMEKMMEKTPTRMVRLSREFLEKEASENQQVVGSNRSLGSDPL